MLWTPSSVISLQPFPKAAQMDLRSCKCTGHSSTNSTAIFLSKYLLRSFEVCLGSLKNQILARGPLISEGASKMSTVSVQSLFKCVGYTKRSFNGTNTNITYTLSNIGRILYFKFLFIDL